MDVENTEYSKQKKDIGVSCNSGAWESEAAPQKAKGHWPEGEHKNSHRHTRSTTKHRPTSPTEYRPTSTTKHRQTDNSSSVSVIKIGSLSFVDSCSSPFIITRILKSNLGSSVQVAGVRCLCDGGKVLSVLCNFQVTVDFSFWVFVPVTVLRFVCQVRPVKLVNMHSWSNSCLFITRK